ncbi:MAG: NAD(+)/NADH kinase [Spirochaetes bacterium]|uniref:NAD kinase n=1 Tax=Candidatus Aphodenecus pullistercoris TaxID=2840669 RepID=A0A9D9HB90_9SPIR|nr:NAD(+)/NADH kinase [Candidatus Aphodenecus pullistercoris]
MDVKNVVIIANLWKDDSLTLAGQMRSWLEERGIGVTLLSTRNLDEDFEIPIRTDLVISVGGDGTVLYSARLVQDLGIPILAVNMGTFGFITEISCTEWMDALEAVLKGEEKISRRLMLRVSVMRGGQKVFQCVGLNEAVVTSSGVAKVINIDLYVGHTKAGIFRSDGIIIATPTGSTGYSLAAGGPIVDSEMSALIVTPVCPFTLSNRPLVVGANEVLTMHVDAGQRTDIMLTVDGQQYFELEEGDDIVVEKSRSRALLIASGVRNYTQVLSSKLNWSGGMHA